MATWYNKYAAITLGAAAGMGAYEAVPWSSLSAPDWAAWVGALGSIGAIVGAFLVGRMQSAAELRKDRILVREDIHRKNQAFLAIAAAAAKHALDIQTAFSGEGRFSRLAVMLTYDKRIISDVIDALALIPLHELGSYSAVTALLSLKDSTIRTQEDIEKALEIPPNLPGPPGGAQQDMLLAEEEQLSRSIVSRCASIQSAFGRLGEALDA